MTLAQFLETIVLPLVRGGPLIVGPVLDDREVTALENELVAEAAPALLREVASARSRLASEIVLCPPRLALQKAEIRLVAGVYDALLLSHPQVSDGRMRLRRAITGFALECVSLESRPGHAALLGRHTLLHNLLSISRTDRRVHFWVGHRDYAGREPPARLLRWRHLRRVRVETAQLNWWAQAPVPPQAKQIIRRALEASPLTAWLAAGRIAPPLTMDPFVFVLTDPDLGRAIAYDAVSRLADVAPVIGAALGRFLDRASDPAQALPLLAFCCQLHLLAALDEGQELLAATQTDASLPEETLDFCAAFAAAWVAGHRPPGLARSPLAARLARRAAWCAQLAGGERLEDWGTRLRQLAPAKAPAAQAEAALRSPKRSA